KQILGFEVAMDDSPGVGLAQRLAGLKDVVACLADRERASLRDHLCQVGALEALHHDERRTRWQRAYLEHADDMLALDRRCSPCLTEEALHRPRVCDLVGGEELDCDGSVEARVESPHHDAHAARTHDGVDSVLGADDVAETGKIPGCVTADRYVHRCVSL